jgi:uncharacterized Fe-S cluster-containing MiaB family protein
MIKSTTKGQNATANSVVETRARLQDKLLILGNSEAAEDDLRGIESALCYDLLCDTLSNNTTRVFKKKVVEK